MGFLSKIRGEKKKNNRKLVMEKDIIDQSPSWNGRILSIQIKGIGLLCTFLVDREDKSVYFTLDTVTYLKRYKELSEFQANKLLIPLCRFSQIPFDDCIVSFYRQGQVISRILMKQLSHKYFIEHSELYPLGTDDFGCGWIIRLSDHNDWWTGRISSGTIHELSS